MLQQPRRQSLQQRWSPRCREYQAAARGSRARSKLLRSRFCASRTIVCNGTAAQHSPWSAFAHPRSAGQPRARSAQCAYLKAMDHPMHISGIDAIAIDIPLTKNFGGSTYAVLKRSTVVTRLRTQSGLVSEVYNGDNREAGPEIVRLIRDELAPLIKGESIFATERIWAKLFARTATSRDRKTLMEAIACIDCAVWDLVGKATGRSVRELMGGFRDRVPIISIGGYYM